MTKKKDNILPEVEVVAKYPHEQRVIDTMNASNAEFIQRLRNNDLRAIHNADGSYSTHVLGNADNMVFPAIQDVNGVLEDYRNLPWQRTLDKAIQNKDYIEFPTEGDARYFGEHYKKYFPEFFNHFGDNQYAEGGEMEKPKHWDELSMVDKSDVMAAAIKNGVTTLEEIKKAWDDYADSYKESNEDKDYSDNSNNRDDSGYSDDSSYEEHQYAKGGYKPSASIKSRIANWEGSSMATNRSFEAEAADFNRVIPASIRAKLNQQQLDALYSYGYNVGMGNLKARVLPMLKQYAQGRAGAKDVANSMWASLDYNPKYRGLRNRRNIERKMFMGYAPSDMQGTMVEKAINMDLSHLPTMYFKGEVSNPLIEHPYYIAPKIELPQEEEKPVAIEGLDKSLDEDTGLSNFLKLQQMMNVVGMNGGNTGNSFLEAWNNFLNENIFADGGDKGVTSSNGSYHVNPADYWAVLSNAENGKPVEVTTPEVTVTAADPKNYRSAFHPEDTGTFFDIAMGPFGMVLPNVFKGTQAIIDKDYKTAGEEVLKGILPMDNTLGHTANLALGIDQLINKNGVQKTYNYLENGDYGKAAMSGAGDVLNGLMTGYGANGLYRDVKSVDFIKNNFIKKAIDNEINNNTALNTNKNEIPFEEKEKAVKRMLDFINSEDYKNRFKAAGMKKEWNQLQEYISKRLDINKLPVHYADIIGNNPKIKGMTEVIPFYSDYGITLKRGQTYEDFIDNFYHELAHWSTSNMGRNHLSNIARALLSGEMYRPVLGKIMKYNNKIAPSRSWGDFVNEDLPKDISPAKLVKKKKRFEYLSDDQEKRSRIMTMIDRAKREGLTTDQFVDKYTKNGKIVDSAPSQLIDLGWIYTPKNIKECLTKTLSVATSIGVGTKQINKQSNE